MRSKYWMIPIVIAAFLLSYGIYRYRMIPTVVQQTEQTVATVIKEHRIAQIPNIIRVNKDGEIWIIEINKKAIKEIYNYNMVVRLQIGYCYWDSWQLVKGMVVFCPEWHPPFNKNGVVVSLVSNEKYLVSVKVW